MKLTRTPLFLLPSILLIFLCFSQTQAQKFQFENRVQKDFVYTAAHAFQNKYFVAIEIDDYNTSQDPIYTVLIADSNLVEIETFKVSFTEFEYDEEHTRVEIIESRENPKRSKFGTIIITNREKQFAAIQIDLKNRMHKILEGNLPDRVEYSDVFASAKKTFIIGLHKREGFYIVPLNFDEKTADPVYPTSINSSENLSNFKLEGIHYLPLDKHFIISLTNYNQKKNAGETKLLFVDTDGGLVSEMDFEPMANRMFYGLSFHQEDDGSIIVGGAMHGDKLNAYKYNHSFGHLFGESVFVLKWNKNKDQAFFQTIAIDDLDKIRPYVFMGIHPGFPTLSWANKKYNKLHKKRQKKLAKGKNPENSQTHFITRNIHILEDYIFLTGDFWKRPSGDITVNAATGQTYTGRREDQLIPFFTGVIVFDRTSGEYYLNTASRQLTDGQVYNALTTPDFSPEGSYPEIIMENDSTFVVLAKGVAYLSYTQYDFADGKKNGQAIVSMSLSEASGNEKEKLSRHTRGKIERWYDDYFIWTYLDGKICVKNRFIPRQPGDPGFIDFSILDGL